MEDLFIGLGVIAVGALALVLFGVYSVYGGFKADLCNAKPGQVFNFEFINVAYYYITNTISLLYSNYKLHTHPSFLRTLLLPHFNLTS